MGQPAGGDTQQDAEPTQITNEHGDVFVVADSVRFRSDIAISKLEPQMFPYLSRSGVIVGIREPTVKNNIAVLFEDSTEAMHVNSSLLTILGWNFVK